MTTCPCSQGADASGVYSRFGLKNEAHAEGGFGLDIHCTGASATRRLHIQTWSFSRSGFVIKHTHTHAIQITEPLCAMRSPTLGTSNEGDRGLDMGMLAQDLNEDSRGNRSDSDLICEHSQVSVNARA